MTLDILDTYPDRPAAFDALHPDDTTVAEAATQYGTSYAAWAAYRRGVRGVPLSILTRLAVDCFGAGVEVVEAFGKVMVVRPGPQA